MRGYDHRRAALFVEASDEFAHLQYAGRVKPVDGFVEEKYFGVARERHCYRKPLFHTE